MFDHNVEQRRIADSNGVSFNRFRQAHATTRKETMAFIKHIFMHYEDLPYYMPIDNMLF